MLGKISRYRQIRRESNYKSVYVNDNSRWVQPMAIDGSTVFGVEMQTLIIRIGNKMD
jgi:hypothetical protein